VITVDIVFQNSLLSGSLSCILVSVSFLLS